MNFVEAVKAMLRLDPDYLMLGEICDTDSASAALTAASSGRALMSTLHSRDAVAVVETLRNYDLSGHEISANLMLVVSQRLVRRSAPGRITMRNTGCMNWDARSRTRSGMPTAVNSATASATGGASVCLRCGVLMLRSTS